jgi:hypothetical protein
MNFERSTYSRSSGSSGADGAERHLPLRRSHRLHEVRTRRDEWRLHRREQHLRAADRVLGRPDVLTSANGVELRRPDQERQRNGHRLRRRHLRSVPVRPNVRFGEWLHFGKLRRRQVPVGSGAGEIRVVIP